MTLLKGVKKAERSKSQKLALFRTCYTLSWGGDHDGGKKSAVKLQKATEVICEKHIYIDTTCKYTN